MIEEEPAPVPSKGWAEMIRKVYEVDPLICPRCGGRMKVVAFPKTCVPIIEITNRCDLDCPVCLVENGRGRRRGRDLSLAEVGAILDTLVRAEGILELISLSGGEPTVHPEIRDIVRSCGRPEILRTSISTNGLSLAKDDALLDFFADRNVLVSLQFDGFSREVYRCLRGADILSAKESVLEKHVVSLMFQPLSHTGRRDGMAFDPMDRLTIPDVIRMIADASAGRLERSDFTPLPCSHPACFALTYLLRLEDGSLIPLPRLVSVETCLDIIQNRSLPGLESGSFAKSSPGLKAWGFLAWL